MDDLNSKLVQGNPVIQLTAMTFALVTIIVGIAQLSDISDANVFTSIEATILLGASAIILVEELYQGDRTGLRDRDWRMFEGVSVVIGLGGIVTSLLAYISLYTGEVIFALPPEFKALVYFVFSGFVMYELLED